MLGYLTEQMSVRNF